MQKSMNENANTADYHSEAYRAFPSGSMILKHAVSIGFGIVPIGLISCNECLGRGLRGMASSLPVEKYWVSFVRILTGRKA
jgi:hypothetical protein